MKRFLLWILSCVLLLMVSCYENPIMDYFITITDNGQYAEDLTYHIISVATPDGFEDIYYSVDKSSPTSNSCKYSLSSYQGTDSNLHEGILVKEGATIKAVAYKSKNGTAYSTFVSDLTIGVSKWNITIVDNGPYSEDETKHVVTITDSSWQGSIYYNYGKYDNPTSNSTPYYPKKYKTKTNEVYSGILVPAGALIKAVSYQTIGGNEYSSNIVEKDLNQWTISIIDNGPALDDNNKRIVSIVDSTYSSGDIYYTLDGSIPTASSTKYIPAEYVGADSKTYVGVLLTEATIVKAVAERTDENNRLISSFIAAVTTDINEWGISVVDYGEPADDSSKRIISIVDSKWNGSIYYTLNGNDPITSSEGRIRYVPAEQIGADGSTYVGILVDETAIVKAYANATQNNKTQTSYVAEETAGINKWAIAIIDNGPFEEDKNKRVVSIVDSKWTGDIFYLLDDSSDDSEWLAYNPGNYSCVDSRSYNGIVVAEGESIKAVSKIMNSGKSISSLIKEATLGYYQWNITIVDNGPSKDDVSKHIISISDTIESGTIYYTLDESNPSMESSQYAPISVVGSDSNSYTGMLVSEGVTLKAVSYITDKAISYNSFTAKELVSLKIGGKGLAGGIIFYDKGYYSDGWRYLEVYPSSYIGHSEFGYYKDPNRNSNYCYVIGTSDDLGTGQNNTKILAEEINHYQNYKATGVECAAKECSKLSLNGYNDWFIPSKEELNLIFTNLYLTRICDFNEDEYWSSSEYDGGNSWYLKIYEVTGEGRKGYLEKGSRGETHRFFPTRAF